MTLIYFGPTSPARSFILVGPLLIFFPDPHHAFSILNIRITFDTLLPNHYADIHCSKDSEASPIDKMHQIEHDLSDNQVRLIAYAAAGLIFVSVIMMYRQFQSMKMRYPQTSAVGQGPGKVKTT
jgi:hypothetical protein